PEDAEELGLSPNSFDRIEVELASGKTHNLISKEKIKINFFMKKGEIIFGTPVFLRSTKI
ncbi:MAG: hypothetical protein QW831_06280, partial [Candidatus Jordarchaeaceae archaeon]